MHTTLWTYSSDPQCSDYGSRVCSQKNLIKQRLRVLTLKIAEKVALIWCSLHWPSIKSYRIPASRETTCSVKHNYLQTLPSRLDLPSQPSFWAQSANLSQPTASHNSCPWQLGAQDNKALQEWIPNRTFVDPTQLAVEPHLAQVEQVVR